MIVNYILNKILKKSSNERLYLQHDVITVFYDDVMHEVSRATNIAEDKIRSFCEKNLITFNGKRRILHKSNFTNEISINVICNLENKNLIKEISIYGEKFYGLKYDRFISSIKLSNKIWYQQLNWKFKLFSILQLSFIDIKKLLKQLID